MTASWARSSVLAAALLLALAPAVGRTAAPGEIVFASTRAWNEPGEVFLTRVGAHPRDVTRSAGADRWVAASPRGDTIAFWSDRDGREQAYLARPDGTRVRPIRGATADPRTIQFPGEFSADGKTLLLIRGLAATRTDVVLVDVARATAHPLAGHCDSALLSPDGDLVACRRQGNVVVLDRAGKVRWHAAGEPSAWTARGLVLTLPDETRVVDRSGRRLQRYPWQYLAASPDGRWLALARNRGSMLVLQRVGGPWQAVVYVWRPGPVAFTADSTGLAYWTPAGSRLVRVGGGVSKPLVTADGRWSPDGRQLAYVRVARGAPPGAPGTVVIGDRRGARPQVVGHVRDADGLTRLVWLPGGRLLYEEQSRGSFDLYAIRPDGSGLRRLTSDPRDETDPAWSPDGLRLVYSRSDQARTIAECGQGNCSSTLLVAGADGSSPKPFTTFTSNDGLNVDARPTWSPRGDAVAFQHDGPLGLSLAVATIVPPPDAAPPPVAVADLTRHAEPAWSPDGSWIAYVDDVGVEGLAPDGSRRRLLLRRPGARPVHDPAWSPDGKLLAFIAGGALYVAPVGATARRVAGGGAARPSFSPDGQSIVFVRRNDLAVVGVDGSGLHAITHTPLLDESGPAWRPAA